MKNIAILCKDDSRQAEAEKLAKILNIPHIQNPSASEGENIKALLILEKDHLSLELTANDAPGPIFVDFIRGPLEYRHRFGGGKKQLIARAVGIKPKEKLVVLDLTAGLGRDAFVLAALGCDVVMCEKSAIIHALLQDGLTRASSENWFQQLSLKLVFADSLHYLSQLHSENFPDVIYLDPMFPDLNKSALNKKEMRILKEIVGDDLDSAQLLQCALSKAKKRVVVKRAKSAPAIDNQKPDIIFEGKSSRFDVYLSGRKRRAATTSSFGIGVANNKL